MRYAATLLTLAALCGAGAPVAAQTVSGQLVDAGTRQPLVSATLSLLRDSAVVVSAVTDSAGNFVLRAPQAGSFRLRAERLGYRVAVTPPIDLAARDTVRVEFRLSVDAVELNPITVTGYSARPTGLLGGFYDRQRRNIGGRFITREDIDRATPLRTTDLLRTVPGVTLVPSRRGSGYNVQVRGRCSPRVFLDGVPVRLLGMTIDDLIQPMILEGIEIYRGPGEIPGEFSQGACGAIVLWTRRGA